MNAKIDTFVKLALIFFISLLSFAIGTFVGKKYSDSQYKMASLEKGHKGPSAGHDTAKAGEHGEEATASEHDREVASIPKAEGHGEKATTDNEIMNDEEITKLAEEMGGSNKTHDIPMHGSLGDKSAEKENAHGEAKKEDTKTDKNQLDSHGSGQFSKAGKSKEKSSTEKPLDVATKMTGGEKKEASAKERREPTSLHPNLGQYEGGKFTVQIAAFANKGEAEARVYGLKEKGFEAFFIPAQVNGRTWYRVNVGLFASESEAKDYKKGFMNKTKTDAAIVQRISE